MMLEALRSLFDKAIPVKVSITSEYDQRWEEFQLNINRSSWIPEKESLTDEVELKMRKFLVEDWRDPVYKSFNTFDDLLNNAADRCMMKIYDAANELAPKKERSKSSRAKYEEHANLIKRLRIFANVLERRGLPQETYEMLLRIGVTESKIEDINVIRLVDRELTKHLGTL